MISLAAGVILFARVASVSAADCAVSGIAVVAGSGAEYSAQAQDGAGVPCHVPETLRLSFESSGAGSFLAPGGGTVSLFISKNSANRNFNYQGGSAGDVLTVKAGYGPADGWSARWQTTHTISATAPSVGTSGSSQPSSAGSSGASVTEVKSVAEPSKGAVAAPRIFAGDALTLTLGHATRASVGAQVQFVATPGGLAARELMTVRYLWNFGDGATSIERTPMHAYTRPGEYIVVVRARRQGHEITLRSTVTVLPVAVSLERDADGVLLLRNNAPHEIEVSGLTVSDGVRSFILPPQTHLPRGGALALEQLVAGLAAMLSQKVFVYDRANVMLAQYPPSAQGTPPDASTLASGGAGVFPASTPSAVSPRALRATLTAAPALAASASVTAPDDRAADVRAEAGLSADMGTPLPALPFPLSRAAPLAFVGVLAAGLFALYAPKFL